MVIIMVETNSTKRITLVKEHVIVPISILSLLGLIMIASLIQQGILPILNVHPWETINGILSNQLYILILSVSMLILLYFLNKENFKNFFRMGEIFSDAETVPLLRLKESTWKTFGVKLTLMITLGTCIYMVMGVISMNAFNLNVLVYLPWILLFSLTNSFTEEILTRAAIVFSLFGKVSNRQIYWLSAVVFGVLHYFGSPGGLIGVLMAGFLGWFLAKSVVETKGIFWAWFIHFLQDVVILTFFFMMLLSI